MSDTPIYDELVRDVRRRGGERIDEVLAAVRAEVAAVQRWAEEQVAEAWRVATVRVADAERLRGEVLQQIDLVERGVRVRAALIADEPAGDARDVEATRALLVDLRDVTVDLDEEPGVDDLEADDELERTPPSIPGFAELLAASRGTARYLEALFGRA